MQSVKWTYYGDDSTYTNAKATYGTKFAADNWMHKAHGNPAWTYQVTALYIAGRNRWNRLLDNYNFSTWI